MARLHATDRISCLRGQGARPGRIGTTQRPKACGTFRSSIVLLCACHGRAHDCSDMGGSLVTRTEGRHHTMYLQVLANVHMHSCEGNDGGASATFACVQQLGKSWTCVRNGHQRIQNTPSGPISLLPKSSMGHLEDTGCLFWKWIPERYRPVSCLF